MTRDAIPITLISDATGSLGEHMLNAVLTQFPPSTFKVRSVPFANNVAAEQRSLDMIRQQEFGVVVHATISRDFKAAIDKLCSEKCLPVLDLTHSLVELLSTVSGIEQAANYSKLHELNETYFKRIQAIEFTIDHDDGQCLSTLHKADVVLVGVSRSTKTPTSMVLAVQGYACANVPLVVGMDPPNELLRIDPRKVVCLVMKPQALAAVRSGRVQHELGYDGGYTDLRQVQEEAVQARRWAEKQGWAVIDVTGRAIEETAVKVLHVLTKKT